MAKSQQTQAARRNVPKAPRSMAKIVALSHPPSKTRAARREHDPAVASRKRTDGTSSRIRTGLYEMARRRDLPIRPEMDRGELAGS